MFSLGLFKKLNKDGQCVIVSERADPSGTGFFAKHRKKTFAFANGFVFQTEGAKACFSEDIQKRGFVIPNSINRSEVEVVPFADRKKKIVCVGRFELKQKRQDVLIKAFEIFYEKHPEYELVFYGDGEDMQASKAMADSSKASKNIMFPGAVKPIEQYIKDASMLVMPSDYEGIPNAIIEAMNMEIPVVSTDCRPGGARMLLGENEYGRVVPIGDFEGLAREMCYVADNYEAAQELSIPFKFYFGPNQFSILKSEGYNFEKIVPLGRNIIGWINRFVIIPLFDLFNGSIANYGIIILLLTLIIKLVVSPLTIKSYMSSAKMNVLRPEIEKINAKYPKEQDAMKKQQEIMALYQKAGVSMFGGCLPMLLQFPILIAMFRFFPASIELRQQPFLWAEDLSTYDSIIDFGFNIPLLGDHISLFSLLCAVTMYFSAKLTQGAQMDSNPQAKSMKFMTLYFMPVFMFFICNNLSSGLTYYYFLSNIIMMIQTIVIRKFFVDEKKIMEKIRLASVKGANKPKSKFQQRLEAMQKAQQEAMREQQKNRR